MITARILSMLDRRGQVFLAVLAAAIVLVPVLNLLVPPGSPLHGIPNLHLTPRLGSHTREAKLRASWYVAQRIHETLSPDQARREAGLSDFSSLDSTGFPESGDPQAVTPSQWGSVALHRD